MRRRTFIPCSPNPLEERITPSHGGLSSAATSTHVSPAASAQTLNLYGFILGSDKVDGTVHKLNSSSRSLSPLGTVSLTGHLIIPLKAGANRPVHGIVTISNAQGSITVSLRGTATVSNAPFSLVCR